MVGRQTWITDPTNSVSLPVTLRPQIRAPFTPPTMHTPRRKSLLCPLPDPFLSVPKLPILAVAIAVFLFAAVLYGEDIRTLAEYSWWRYRAAAEYSVLGEGAADGDVRLPEGCDLTRGEWVLDPASPPLYREDQCDFLSRQVSCVLNGRPELMYQKWRWQPENCSFPRFQARRLLERLKGKRMVFAGDSINRNQWESMVCLLQAAVPPGRRSRVVDGSRIIFPVQEYNASIEFYWSPFLVESNSDEPEFHSIPVRIINLDVVETHAEHWKTADVLIFNTYIWWMNTPYIKVLRPGATPKNWTDNYEIPRGEAYERVLRTVFNWVDHNKDPNRTTVFFMSMSPLHGRSADWGNPEGIKCAKETMPILNMTGVQVGTDMSLWAAAKKAAESTTRVPVTFVDVTSMSDRRKDAHTSVYTMQQGELLTTEQKADPARFADCIHWCVPGVPDIWNQIIYARLLSGR